MKYSLSAVVPSERLSRVGVFLSLSELFASDYENLNPTTSIVEISCFKIDNKSASALRILDLEWVLVKVSAKKWSSFLSSGQNRPFSKPLRSLCRACKKNSYRLDRIKAVIGRGERDLPLTVHIYPVIVAHYHGLSA